MAIPQDVLPTTASKSAFMSKSELNYRAQATRTATMSGPVSIHFHSDNNSNTACLRSSSNTSRPATVRNAETLLRRDLSLEHARDKTITEPLSISSPFLILLEGGRNPTTDFREQSSNTQSPFGHMTKSETLATERSFVCATVIDIPPETPRYSPPRLTISPIYSIYSSADSYNENLHQDSRKGKVPTTTPPLIRNERLYPNSHIDTPFNDAQQENISYQVEQVAPGPDEQHHPGSVKSSGIVESRDKEKRLKLETKLNGQHLKCLQSRSLGYEKRATLRHLRAEMRDADEDYMKHVRESHVQQNPVNLALSASFERLLAARKDYGSLEELYDEHEGTLDREEYSITLLQERMLSGVRQAQNGDNDVSSISDSSEEEGSDDSEGIGMKEPYHPLYEEYLSRFGDLKLCQEEHFNLVSEYDALLEQKEMRQKYGEPVHPQTEIIVAKFPRAESKILERLEMIEADVERLRQACIQEGLLNESDDEECVSLSEESDILMSPDGSQNFQQSEYQKYSLLLEQPDHKENGDQSDTLRTRFGGEDIGSRITWWLLHKLRSSCLEVELLKRYADGQGPAVDTRKWQQDVLDFWFIDEANLPVSAYQLEPTLTDFTPSSTTDLNKVAPSSFGNKEHIQLVIRSSSLSRTLEFELWLKLARMKGKSSMSVL